MEEATRTRTNQAVALSKEVKELRLEKAKFERLGEDIAKKLAAEQEVSIVVMVPF
jgi:hypothetical protein